MASTVLITTQNDALVYNLEASTHDFKTLSIFDIQGKKISETSISEKRGFVSTKTLSTGLYIATFVVDSNTSVSKKFIVK